MQHKTTKQYRNLDPTNDVGPFDKLLQPEFKKREGRRIVRWTKKACFPPRVKNSPFFLENLSRSKIEHVVSDFHWLKHGGNIWLQSNSGSCIDMAVEIGMEAIRAGFTTTYVDVRDLTLFVPLILEKPGKFLVDTDFLIIARFDPVMFPETIPLFDQIVSRRHGFGRSICVASGQPLDTLMRESSHLKDRASRLERFSYECINISLDESETGLTE